MGNYLSRLAAVVILAIALISGLTGSVYAQSKKPIDDPLRPYKTFSKEFKLEAVRMCEDRPVAEVARSLGVHDNSIYRWRQELSEDGPDAFRGNGNRTALEEENRRLKRAVAELTLDNQMLKDVASKKW